jgi:hypothetical protein
MLAGCSPNTSGLNNPTTPIVTAAPSTTTTTKPVPTVGSTVSLADGDGSADTFTVTLLKVVDPAEPAPTSPKPPAGYSLAEVLIKITATAGFYNDDANHVVTLIGSDGRTYGAGTGRVKGCNDFKDGLVAVSSGQSVTGCVTIEIKKDVTVLRVAYVPGVGGPSDPVGEWKVA